MIVKDITLHLTIVPKHSRGRKSQAVQERARVRGQPYKWTLIMLHNTTFILLYDAIQPMAGTCSIRVVLCLTINTSRVHLTIGVVLCPNKHFLYKLHNNWRNPNNTKTWYLCASTGITTENILKWPSPPKSIRDIWPRDRKNNNLK